MDLKYKFSLRQQNKATDSIDPIRFLAYRYFEEMSRIQTAGKRKRARSKPERNRRKGPSSRAITLDTLRETAVSHV
ncbi:hypothetical protein COLO4_18332 [Corchorus olitorius]|uniref:Uncharacterized protein n=1 Tax=Corchorus olitorius TaxID=93759 RepID=A0A1R3J9N5_9ROSI|nr:hypothetical protein COLO4_18332 [Corchorus olitorius]